jgi:two-component system response regulator DctR
MHPLQVILVEDDPMVQEVHRQYIEKIDGFTVIGAASNGLKGLELARKYQPDLAIVDLYMPYLSGIEMLKGLRSEGLSIDIVAITAASDIETIHKVLQHGAFDYIMKPFTFERIKKSLKNYQIYRSGLKEKINLSQQELDKLLFASLNDQNENGSGALPKGLNDKTLKKIIGFISSEENNPVSAEEVAEGVGIARVTARRYLDFLEKEGKVRIHVQYGGVGRPINRYGKL